MIYQSYIEVNNEAELLKKQQSYLNSLPFRVGDFVFLTDKPNIKKIVKDIWLPLHTCSNEVYVLQDSIHHNKDVNLSVISVKIDKIKKWTSIQERLYTK